MANKENIIYNVGDYTPNEIARFILDGVVTYEELCEEPEFSHRSRKEVVRLLENAKTESNEDSDWQAIVAADTIEQYDRYLHQYPEGKYRQQARDAKWRLQQKDDEGEDDDDTRIVQENEENWLRVNKNDVDALRRFVSENPNSAHVSEANRIINELSYDRYRDPDIVLMKRDIAAEADDILAVEIIKRYLNENRVSLDQLYDEIRKNHSLLSTAVIKRLRDENIITFDDLVTKSNIDPRYLEFITNNVSAEIDLDHIVATPLNGVSQKTTEVYFWGIPASGKTCALGAVMCETMRGSLVDFAEQNKDCQGYDYMNRLSQIFENTGHAFRLPMGTQTDAIFEMGFNIHKDNRVYPITFLDLAGETIHSMYLINSREDVNQKQADGLNTVCTLLKGNKGINRKIHFFVVEYNGHEKKYQGKTQANLLNAAMSFINGDRSIFGKETDAIYLIITKADLTGARNRRKRIEILRDYMQTHYKQFYNGLRILCKNNEINNGQVDIIPFSIGDVCFQNLCLFDNTDAKTILEQILNRAKSFKTGKFANIVNKFRK